MKTKSLVFPVISLITLAGTAHAQIAIDHSTNNTHNLQPTSHSIAVEGDVSWELIRPSNTGIPGDNNLTLFIDDDDSPWIAGFEVFHEEGGMSHFDGTKWNVLSNVECNQMASPRFNDIVKTDDGIMWIATDIGLLRFDPSVEPWCVTRFDNHNTPMQSNEISGLDIAPDGTLWIANGRSSASGGLGHYDPATDTWEFWNTNNGVPWLPNFNTVNYVAAQPDIAGGYTVWFGSRDMAITSFKDGVFTWFDPANPPNVTPLPKTLLGKNNVDEQGNMLVHTDQGMALRATDGTYTMLTGSPEPIFGYTSRVDVLDSGRVLATLSFETLMWDGSWSSLGQWGSGFSFAYGEESNGSIWVSGTGGAAHYENGLWQRYRVTNTGMLDFFPKGIAFAPNGDVAMTANISPGVGGFDILHPNESWTNANALNYGIGLPWSFGADNTTAVAYRPNGNILFSPTNHGLQEFDGEGYTRLIGNEWSIEHIVADASGRVWASSGQASLFRETDDGSSMVRSGYAQGLPSVGVVDLITDPNDPNAIWVGATHSLGRTSDGVTWEIVPREAVGLELNSTGHFITGFDVATDGTLWISSGVGLFHLDTTTGLYDTYDLTNSPWPTDDIWNVEIAPDGSVWISMQGTFPFPGGVAQLKDGVWRVWEAATSPLPHNQVWDLETRSIAGGGYEVWIATASEAMAVMTIEGPASCPADLNGDGELNFFDISEFLNIMPDFNNDGKFNFFDVSEFLSAFGAGCP